MDDFSNQAPKEAIEDGTTKPVENREMGQDTQDTEAPDELKDIVWATTMFEKDSDKNNRSTTNTSAAVDYDMLRTVEDAVKFRKEKKARTLMTLSLCLAIAIGILEFSNYFTIKSTMEMVKDTKVQEEGTLLSKDDQPIATNSNEYSIMIGAIGFLPPKHVSKIDSLNLELPDGRRIYRHIEAIDIHPGHGFAITTSSDDKLVWDPTDDSSGDMTVTLSNGDTFQKSVDCEECSTLNVVHDDSVIEAIESFIAFLTELDDGSRKPLDVSCRTICTPWYCARNPDVCRLAGCNQRG